MMASRMRAGARRGAAGACIPVVFLATLIAAGGPAVVLAAMPVNGAWQVAAGSIGNQLELELHNLDATTMTGPLSVNVIDAPAWMSAISIFPPAGTAARGPAEVTTVTMGFNITGGTPLGTRGDLTVLITEAGGDSWTKQVSFEIAERPDEIQTDCCSAIEISTTGVGSPGFMAPDGLPIQTVPNPSNPVTSIRFSLAAGGNARITIHDVSGRLVRVLASQSFDAGPHEIRWDGRTDRGEPAPGGIYFVRVETGGVTRSAKMALTR